MTTSADDVRRKLEAGGLGLAEKAEARRKLKAALHRLSDHEIDAAIERTNAKVNPDASREFKLATLAALAIDDLRGLLGDEILDEAAPDVPKAVEDAAREAEKIATESDDEVRRKLAAYEEDCRCKLLDGKATPDGKPLGKCSKDEGHDGPCVVEEPFIDTGQAGDPATAEPPDDEDAEEPSEARQEPPAEDDSSVAQEGDRAEDGEGGPTEAAIDDAARRAEEAAKLFDRWYDAEVEKGSKDPLADEAKRRYGTTNKLSDQDALAEIADRSGIVGGSVNTLFRGAKIPSRTSIVRKLNDLRRKAAHEALLYDFREAVVLDEEDRERTEKAVAESYADEIVEKAGVDQAVASEGSPEASEEPPAEEPPTAAEAKANDEAVEEPIYSYRVTSKTDPENWVEVETRYGHGRAAEKGAAELQIAPDGVDVERIRPGSLDEPKPRRKRKVASAKDVVEEARSLVIERDDLLDRLAVLDRKRKELRDQIARKVEAICSLLKDADTDLLPFPETEPDDDEDLIVDEAMPGPRSSAL